MVSELTPNLLQLAYTLIFLLLVTVTGGILYLTFAEWWDRRRYEREEEPPRKSGKRR
ncbi:MAG: hypothetical protein HC921_13685 [Synechococcaceae cyanobacterium SM2_3_1]|nr:hypothetical protein [Synechococcaceae cyanobacterium SM2_3_1]